MDAQRGPKSDKNRRIRGTGMVMEKVWILEGAEVSFRCSRCSESIDFAFPPGTETSPKRSRKSMKNREK